MNSIADRMKQVGGHSAGFDYLRLLLAISVVVLHVAAVCHGARGEFAVFVSPIRPFVRFILPAFFALSGFLVAGSLERCATVGMFLGLRFLRVIPALTFKVLLAALVLGPLATSMSLHAYLRDPGFFSYFGNIAGVVQFSLPGVFLDNPLPNVVNGQLWTIPFELASYVLLAVLALLGIRRWRVIGPVAAIALTLAYLLVTWLRHDWRLVPVPGMPNGALLIACSLWGISLYHYRERVPYSAALCGLAALVTIACLGWLPYGDFIAPLPAAYVTVYLGLRNPDRRILHKADYSYGIYLSSFMIQQASWHFLPIARSWQGNLLISLPAAFALAAVSWHFIERPALGMRYRLQALETRYLRWRRPGGELGLSGQSFSPADRA